MYNVTGEDNYVDTVTVYTEYVAYTIHSAIRSESSESVGE